MYDRIFNEIPAKNSICTPHLYIHYSGQPYTFHMSRVGQNHTFIGIYGVCTVFLAGKSPYIRSYKVCIYGSGQPYKCHMSLPSKTFIATHGREFSVSAPEQ